MYPRSTFHRLEPAAHQRSSRASGVFQALIGHSRRSRTSGLRSLPVHPHPALHTHLIPALGCPFAGAPSENGMPSRNAIILASGHVSQHGQTAERPKALLELRLLLSIVRSTH